MKSIHSHSEEATALRVKRRKVFYIPGYDPIHPRRYRELYRTESKDQGRISGYDIELSAKHTGARYGWHVNADIDGHVTESDFEVLVWSDIVRDSMSNTSAATYAQLIKTAWIHISIGVLWRLMKLRKGPVIAALYPVVFLLGQPGFAFWLGTVVYRLLNWAMQAGVGLSIWPISMTAAVVASWCVLRWFKTNDNKSFAYYLIHDYSYSAATYGAYSPALKQRIAEFSGAIFDALHGDVDEVLVVGHSSGAHLAVSALVDVLRDGNLRTHQPALAFLSVGQVVPMVSFLPDADELRRDLHYLSEAVPLTWVDVTAPRDGCAFALCDPVAVSGVARSTQRWPLVISAAFSQTLSAARWKALRWRFFRLHFQYLWAFDRPADYDYFQISAGPVSLAERFKGRAPSKSRIVRAVSKFTKTAP
ncbi:hypothetical protein [Nereida sp.]|uniref:hypothetical protein n=1 Tax=Nereida sp. TaxID=2736090 RepID=UPI003F69808D